MFRGQARIYAGTRPTDCVGSKDVDSHVEILRYLMNLARMGFTPMSLTSYGFRTWEHPSGFVIDILFYHYTPDPYAL